MRCIVAAQKMQVSFMARYICNICVAATYNDDYYLFAIGSIMTWSISTAFLYIFLLRNVYRFLSFAAIIEAATRLTNVNSCSYCPMNYGQ